MDPVTHFVSGALGGRTLRDTFDTRLAYVLCIVAAWIPDIDNFVGLGPEEYLLYHRGVTHSVTGIVVQALVLAGVFRLIGKNFTPLKTAAAAAGLLCLHVWLDVITTYGTQLLAPFDDTRFHYGSVFIIDPFMTLAALALLVASLFARRWGRRLAVTGLILLVAYPLACRSVRNSVITALPPILERQDLAGLPYEVSTDALSPIWWKVVVHDGDRLLVGAVSALPSVQDRLHFDEFTAADEALLDRLGEKASFFRTWRWFAMYPVMRDAAVPPGLEGERAVTFSDVRFLAVTPPVRELMAQRGTPFEITAVLDGNDEMTGFVYNHHSATTAYSVTN